LLRTSVLTARPQAPTNRANARPRVSVVIPTLNEPRNQPQVFAPLPRDN
jgi:hypothetical protein